MIHRFNASTAAVVLALTALTSRAESTPASTASVQVTSDRDAELPYWNRAREGWFWQIDPEPAPKPVQPAAPAKSPEPPQSDEDRDVAELNAFKATLERALNAATQNPSEANVARFLEVYAQARQKASVFADTAQALAVRMPWIDSTFSGSRPALPVAQRAYDSIQLQDRDQLLREMAQSYGLYFFFRRNCAYCHVQGPMLRQFQAKYGFTVYAVSMDGGVLPDFPEPVFNQGLAEQVANAIGVPQQDFVVPAVILARPTTREVVPVGFGAMTMDEMADRVAMVVRVRDNGAGRASRTSLAALTGAEAPPSAELARRARGAAEPIPTPRNR